LSSTSWAQKCKITIYGSLENSKIKKIYFYTENIEKKIDSVSVHKGRFIINKHVKCGERLILFLKKERKISSINSYIIYPDSSIIELTIIGNNFKNVDINTDKTNLERNRFNNGLKPYISKYENNRVIIDRINHRLESDSNLKLNKVIRDSLKAHLTYEDAIAEDVTNLKYDFIDNNPGSFFSLELLEMFTNRATYDTTIDLFKARFEKLRPLVKYSTKGNKLKLSFERVESSKVGKIAPRFSAVTIQGKKINNSSFHKVSFTILDFWASWCIPCREEFPFLKTLYKNYGLLGLQIIGLSEDTKKSLFINAIKEENLPWENALLEWKNVEFNVPAIPMKYLIDKNGIIIGKWLGNDVKFEEELENILKNSFREKRVK
jgi:peroxiredoxin